MLTISNTSPLLRITQLQFQLHEYKAGLDNDMKTETLLPVTSDEQQFLMMIRRLPTASVLQLIEFARFLEFKIQCQNQVTEPDNRVNLQEQNDPWDNLLAQPKAKRRLRELAQEALVEERNGHTTEIKVTPDGRLAPA